MIDFLIPKGNDHIFTIDVQDADSFLPQDLTNMSSAVFKIFSKETMSSIAEINLTVLDALNGVLKGVIPRAITSTLEIGRGAKEDGYYIKPLYQATIEILFTDGTIPVFSLINDVAAEPAGN